MKFYRSLKLSKNSFLANKLSSFLALVGISIGVATVIIMVAIGQGMKREVLRQVEQIGANLLTIKAGQGKKQIGRERQLGDVTTLTVRDAEAIAGNISLVRRVAPVQDKDMRIKYGDISTMTKVLGTTPNFAEIRNYSLARGRMFSEDENKAGLRAAVIGRDVCKNLFKDQVPIGKIIRIGKAPFEVIGVLEPVGASPEGANEDMQVLIPIRTALRRVFNVAYLKLIYVQVWDRSKMVKAELQIRELLRERRRLDRRHKSDDFTIHNQVTALEMERESTDSFTLLIAGIAAIAFLVGGVGILAIMLLAIKERTHEIGLRRAVGARARDILFQFLSEASLLGLAGGLLGMFIGIVGIWMVDITTAITTAIPVWTMILSFLISLTEGFFFGVYPARKASLLDPIEALRAN